MKCLSSLTLLFLCVSAIHGSQSRSVRETIEERCNQLCIRYHRQGPCTGGLPRCGPCIHGYVERDGICRDVLNEERIDAIEELVNEFRELEAEKVERQRAKQDADFQVIPGEDIEDEIINLESLTNEAQDLQNTDNSNDDISNLGDTRANIASESLTAAESSASSSQSRSGSNNRDTAENCDNCAVRVATDTEPASLQLASNIDSGNSEPQDTYILTNGLFIAVVAGCSVAGLIGLVVAGVCWYKLQKNVKATSEVEYPAYGITGPTKERVGSPGDRKLAQSAQMYHYQHQKQQMIAMEKANGEMKHDGSEEDSEDENEEGDYTVYECPGLAPTGEMEVKNPLFNDETPVTPTADDRGGDQK